MTAQTKARPTAIRVVIPFVFRHWLAQSVRAATVALGLVSMILRLIGLRAIVPFTLRIMSDVSRDAFMRVQRFSTDWHANSFAGSTVRKVTRGMWALDLLNDTILMAPLRSQIAIAQQDSILFHRSLAENIAYGRPGASMAAIEQAARARQCPRVHPAAAERLWHAGRRARRQAVRRRAAAGRAGARLSRRRAGADSGRSDLEQGTHAALANRAGGIYRGLLERQATEFGRVSAAEWRSVSFRGSPHG